MIVLRFLSYICATLFIVFAVMLAMECRSNNPGTLDLVIISVAFISGVTQIYYNYKTANSLNTEDSTRALDEEYPRTSLVSKNAPALKFIAFINNIIYIVSLVFGIWIYNRWIGWITDIVQGYLRTFLRQLMIPVIAFTIPAIIYNLRTYNLRRIIIS